MSELFSDEKQDEILTVSVQLPKTELLSEDTDQDEGTLDLAHLRDLLSLLSEFRVAGFNGAGIAVTFKEDAESLDRPAKGRTRAQILEDEDSSTSSRPVSGFGSDKDGWRNPNLWPTQAGRALKLDGSLE